MCYDHLAGELAVWPERMVAKRAFVIEPQCLASAPGARWFASREISLDSLANPRRVLCRPCLDWGERLHHLAGALGAALMQQCSRCAGPLENSRVVALRRTASASSGE
jgi:hypothetical protein